MGIFTRAKCLKRDLANPYAFAEINPCFDHRFPIGTQVRAFGLSKAELNDRVGVVTKYDEAKLRVGVQFAAPFGLLSIKHCNLAMADGGEARGKMLLEKYDKSSHRSRREAETRNR